MFGPSTITIWYRACADARVDVERFGCVSEFYFGIFFRSSPLNLTSSRK